LPEIVVVGHERDRQGPAANDLRIGCRRILELVSQHSRPWRSREEASVVPEKNGGKWRDRDEIGDRAITDLAGALQKLHRRSFLDELRFG
jgi:hypothetical protein